MKIFGIEIKRASDDLKTVPSFVPRESDDGAMSVAPGGAYGTYIDLDGSIRSSAALINKYRDMASNQEVDSAIQDIVNQAIVQNPDIKTLTLNLDDTKFSDKIKDLIRNEFEYIQKLLNFNLDSYKIFRQWYIDGRIYYHVVTDPHDINAGIKELRYIDPRKIRKVREIKSTNPNERDALSVIDYEKEYFIFSNKGFQKDNSMGGASASSSSTDGVKISKDSILYVPSGYLDKTHTIVVSYLHKAIKPLNNLRSMEDAVIIYRICLVGDTRVKTRSGTKYLKDIEVGDEAYVFTLDGLELAPVKNKWLTGTKPVYRVRSKHFEVIGTETHPILVLDNNTKIVTYVPISELDPKIHSVVYEKNRSNEDNLISLIDYRTNVCLLRNSEIWSGSDISNKEKSIVDLSIELNIKKSSIRNFLYGLQYIDETDARNILKHFAIDDLAELDIKKQFYADNQVNLPKFIDEDFAELFGFLIGDGSITKNTIVFAEGTDDEQNEYYASLIRKYFGNCVRQNSTTRKYTNWSCSNTIGVSLLRDLGFISGAHNKRIPEWVFLASDDIKSAFIRGLCNADGHIKEDEITGSWQCEIELCNKRLIEDIKDLWTDIGMTSGHIRHRRRAGGHVCVDHVIPETESWTLFLSNNLLPPFEKISSVEYHGEEDVYDIEIDHVKHNFIANGIVVHNSRAPERRIFYIDVGNLPKPKAEQYMNEIMTKFKNKLVYDASTGEIRSDVKFQCYALDTKIPLLDGRTLEIKDIIKEHEEGKTNWVYSCDPVTGKFVPGPVSWAGITKTNSEVVRVTFDNGKSVVCTPDHKFPVWNKGFIEAQHLSVGESMIPGYRRTKEIITKGGAEYEQIYKNDTKKWEYTHREVAAYKSEIGMGEFFINNIKYKDAKKGVVHHKNFNRFDNTPDNLVMMSFKDHTEYHWQLQAIEYTPDILKLVEDCARMQSTIEETIKYVNEHDITSWKLLNLYKNPKNRDVNSLYFSYQDLLRISKINGFKDWRNYRKIFETFRREPNGQRKRGTCDRSSVEWKAKLSVVARNRTVSPSSKTWRVIDPNGSMDIIENLNEYCRKHSLHRSNIKRDYGSRGYHAELLNNHKVVSVERLDEKITVAALTIDQEETYHSHHTYLLDAGVYTKNTILEDFWLPRREGGRGTEISTLPAGCLAMDTKVPLLDGRILTIREIADEYETGKELWTYSGDPKTGKIVPGLISWAGVTQKSAKVMKITFDNNESVIATPDHKFPVQGKGRVEAKDLQIDDSLFPLNTRREKLVKKSNTYEQIFDNEDKKWVWTHRMVAEYLRDTKVCESIYKVSDSHKNVVHHKNFDRYNNDPSNLTWMNWEDHRMYHNSVVGPMIKQKMLDMKNNEPERYKLYLQKRSELSKSMWKNRSKEEYDNLIQTMSISAKKHIEGLTEEKKAVRAENSRANFLKGSLVLREKLASNTEFNDWFSGRISSGWTNEMKLVVAERNKARKGIELNEDQLERHRKNQKMEFHVDHIKFVIDCVKGKTTHQVTATDISDKLNSDERMMELIREINKGKHIPNWDGKFNSNVLIKMAKFFGYENWADFRRKESLFNHRIVSIEYLDEPIEVGTLTIDGQELFHDYHTFFLSPCNIMVFNSNLGELSDVEYFQRLLYKSLNVPSGRLDSTQTFNLGRGAEINRDEDKFSDFITRLRLEFSRLFIQALERQLILKKIVKVTEWDDNVQNIHIRFADSSYYAEIRENEIINMRAETLNSLDAFVGIYFSRNWVQKTILKMTEDDIKKMELEIASERDFENNRQLTTSLDNLSIQTQVHKQAQKDGVVIDPSTGEVMPPQLIPPPPVPPANSGASSKNK